MGLMPMSVFGKRVSTGRTSRKQRYTPSHLSLLCVTGLDSFKEMWIFVMILLQLYGVIIVCTFWNQSNPIVVVSL